MTGVDAGVRVHAARERMKWKAAVNVCCYCGDAEAPEVHYVCPHGDYSHNPRQSTIVFNSFVDSALAAAFLYSLFVSPCSGPLRLILLSISTVFSFSWLNPNRQTDLHCSLDPFVFGLLLMKGPLCPRTLQRDDGSPYR